MGKPTSLLLCVFNLLIPIFDSLKQNPEILLSELKLFVGIVTLFLRKFACLLLFILPFNSQAEKYFDSLWSVWHNPIQADSNRLNALYDIAWDGYLFSKPDSALILAQLEYDYATKKGLKKHQAQALGIMGVYYDNQGNYNKAIDFYKQALALKNEINDIRGVAASLTNIGGAYQIQGDYIKAIDYYTKSLINHELIKNTKAIAITLSNIGTVYATQKDYKKAMEYFEKSLKIRIEINDIRGMVSVYTNIGNCYMLLGNKKNAIKYNLEGLEIAQKNNYKPGIAAILNNIGTLYNEEKKYDTALIYFNKSLELKKELGDKEGIASTLGNIGSAYKEQGNLVKAIEFNKKALAISQEIGSLERTMEIANILFKCYKQNGDYLNALQMHELFLISKDSVISEKNQKEIFKQEMQYNYEKQKSLDEKEHEKTIAISIEQEKKQKVISYSIALGLLLVALFAVFVWNRLRVTRKQKMVIEQQKQLVEVQKNLVEEKQKEILDSINYAKRLQVAILPSETLVKKLLLEGFILYKPKDIVAGDFYWMESTDNVIYFAAADCTGHGVPGAMVSVVCCNALNRVILEFGELEPGKILDKTRELVVETFSKSDTDVKDGMDISLCSINKKTNEIKWAGAYNPLWYVHNGILEELSANKQPIGKTENSIPFTTHSIHLNKGDFIYLFTDGYADQFGGEKGKKFKYKPMKELILSNVALSPGIQKEKLELAFDKWRGHLEQVDDVCIIGIRI